MAATVDSLWTDNNLEGELLSNNLMEGEQTPARDITYALVGEAGARILLNISATDYKMTAILKDRDGNTISTSNLIDLPIESMVVNGSYNNTTKKIILTKQNGSTIEFSIADLINGLQTEITSSNKISSDLINDVSSANKFVTTAEKIIWNNKQDALVSGTNIKTINNQSILGNGNLSIGGQNNIIEDVKVNGTSLPISDKSVNVIVPTKLSQFENDTDFLVENDLQMTKIADVENGSQITDGTGYARLNKIYGNTEQNGTPTPDTPVDIEVVTGDVEITISNSDNTISQENLLSLGNIELCKIEDYQDYIYKENNKWYLHKEIGKVVLDGNESWSLQSINDYGIANFQKSANINDYVLGKANLSFNNYFSPQTSLISNTQTVGYFLNTAKILFVRFESSVASTIIEFKNWLNTHNMILYYVLATPTPTDEEITDTTLISQLESIYNFTMYLGATNFTISSENSLPSLNITYATKNRDFYSKEESNDLLDKKTDKIDVENALNEKQNTLVSGTNIKTINNQSILGSGNINIQGGGSSNPTDVQINGTSITSDGVANIKTNSSYNANSNKIATMNDIPSVPSAGTTASAVSTTSSGGSSTTYSKSDHVHSINNSTIVSALGYTPYNSLNPNGYTTNIGTITSVKMNGSTISTSGEANLGTVLTSHQSIKTINNTSLVGTGNISLQSTLVSGTNIKTINGQSVLGSGDLVISGGSSDYEDLNNKPSINGVSLSGNKTSSSLGLQSTIDSSHRISADLINDSSSTNKFTSASEKATWNGKQEVLVSGTNIKTINNQSLLGSGNITIQGGSGGSLPIYNTVADMKADTDLATGDTVITLGYYVANDGGGATYHIVASTNKYAETLSNGKKAELIIEDDTINVLQMGAKGDNTFDNTNIFKSLIYTDTSNKKIIIPNGIYKTYSWGSNGANQRSTNLELIGINKPTINVIPQSTATLQGTYSSTFTVNPGYLKITTGSSFTIATKELADGQNYYYLKCADKTLIPDGLTSANYLIGEASGIRYGIASVDKDNPDGTGTARIYLYDIAAGNTNKIIFNNSSNTLSENLWLSNYNNNDIWYIDFGSTAVPDYFKTTNRHIAQESTLKHARIKNIFTYNSKEYVEIDCFIDEYYSSSFTNIAPLDNNTTLKVYSNTSVVSSLCSLNRFQNVTIDNIKFNGNNYSIGNYQTNNNDWNLIYFGGCKNITVKNCIFGNAVMAGMHIGGAGNIYAETKHDYPENILIDNCYFYNNGRNDLEIIQGKNITITNCNGHGCLDIEANGAEILDNIHISNCNFNSTTPYRPSASTNFSNINYSNCSFSTIVCQRGARINLINVKCHSLRPYQEAVIKGTNCLIDEINQVYGNEHLHFINSTFLGLTNNNPGSSYGNSKWYFDNCCIDLSLVRAFKLYNNKMFYLKDSVWTCDTEITGNDVKSIMHFNNSEIHNIRITASNNVERNIFDGCTFTSTTGHHSFGWNVLSGIFKNCYIKTDIRSTYGKMTFLDCILGNIEQPVIGASSRGSYINGLKTDDASQDINWDWVYGGGESKLIFKNVYYDVTRSSIGIKAGTSPISSSTVSDESYYLYGNNSSNYIKGVVVYSNTTVTIEKIAIGGASSASSFYSTVAAMKADTELGIGKIVATAGYYAINDGGASLYKIRAAATGEIDNGGSIIILNNGKVAELIVENDTIHVMQFGIQENTDIKNKLSALATYVGTANIGNIIFKTNGIYELTGAIVFNINKLTIWGNNAKIKVQDGIYRALRVYGDTLNIYDLTIDGNDTRQDQWSDTRYPGNITNIYALNTDCHNVYLNNFNILNLWGQGIMALDYNNYIIENCTFNKIGGGFYYTDPETGANDNFGDAFHFGGHNGIANIIINNFHAEGYTTDLNGGRKSRGGLVLEDFIGTTYTPIKTFVTMNNCELINFNRVFHYEGPIGPTTIKFSNGKIVQDDSICVPEYACDLIIENSEINHTELNYGGSNSFRGYNAIIKNSEINIANGATNSLAHACKCEYENCIINNINNTSLMNGTGIFRKCTLNMNGLATYFMYNSTGNFYDCIFNNSSTSSDLAMTESGSKINIYNCIFNNIKPYGNFKDINSKLYLISTATDELIGKYSKTTLYVSNVLKARPNINQVFNATNEINFDSVFTQTNFGSNTSVNLFPATLPTDFTWRSNSKYIMICYGGNADYLRYVQKFNSACYFVTVKTNASGTPSVVGEVVSSTDSASGYNRQLVFNTTNNTISKGTASSNVSRVMYWILPYSYFNEIGTI